MNAPEIPGYTLGSVLFRSASTHMFHATNADRTAVVVKMPARSHPSVREVAQYQRAFDLGTRADPGAVVRHLDIVRYRSSVALITEYFGGQPLRDLVVPSGLSLPAFLDVAVELATALGLLHGSGIVHRDVKPDNVIIRKDGKLRLVDLGISREIDLRAASRAQSHLVDGTLAYMSPEQCGRVADSADERLDLYSFGVTLFELATGRLPFTQTEPVALAHAHVAQPAPLATELRPELPKTIAEILLRLLAKNADDRYSSAFGVLEDLSQCRGDLVRTGVVRPFMLGQSDQSVRFRIPDRLYGRDDEVSRLVGALEAQGEGSRVFAAVSGPSGIGKTALVESVQRRVGPKSRYCAGKFDQFRPDLPYLGILLAFRALVRRELAEPDEVVTVRRAQLQAAVGSQGRLLTDGIPELSSLLGPQPEVPDVSPQDATRRFHGVVARLLAAFATRDEPLVLFVDDIQWADPPSLHLLEALAQEPALRYVAVLLGYRSNEVGPGHPARRTLASLRECAQVTEEIELGPLAPEAVAQLIADTLHVEVEAALPLAVHTHQIAQGSPFFVREFLAALRQQNFFRHDAARGNWTWDLASLAEHAVPENVTSLLTMRLGELEPDCLDLLDTASCIGSEFDLLGVAQVHELSQTVAARGLDPAVRVGLIVPLDDNHEYFGSLAAWELTAEQQSDLGATRYRFQHDKVRQNVHDRLDPLRRAERHLRIGRLLLEGLTDEERVHRVVDVFNHIVYGVEGVTDREERLAFAKIGLEAGQTALRALAFDSSWTLLETARGLLPDNAWESAYELSMGLHVAAAQSAHARRDYVAFEELADVVIARARSALDAAPAYGMRVRVWTSQTRYSEAVDVGVAFARQLGVSLPRKPKTHHVLFAVARTLWAQGRTHPTKYAALPACRDPKIEAAIAILGESASAAYFAEPNLLPHIGVTTTRLSINHGLTNQSSYGFAVWALVLAGVLGHIRNGAAFADLAFEVGRRYGGAFQSRTEFTGYAYTSHWLEPLGGVADRLHQIWAFNRDAGDEETATYSGGVMLYTHFLAGETLDTNRRYEDTVRYIRAAQQPQVKHCFLAWIELFDALEARALPDDLIGPSYDHPTMLPTFEATNNAVQIAISSLAAGLLDFFAGRHERAAERFAVTRKHEENIVGQVIVPGLDFFQALNAYALMRKGATGSQLRSDVARGAKRMRTGAGYQTETFGSRLAILEGCELLQKGRLPQAIIRLHEAIALSSPDAHMYRGITLGLLSEACTRQGLAEEARQMRGRRDIELAAWGAHALTESVAEVHSESLPRTGTRQMHKGAMDLSVLLGAVAAISGEIDEATLVARLMATTIAAAGADRALLILLDADGHPLVEAVAELGGEVQRPRSPVDGSTAIARPIFDLTRRSGQTVVVDDARKDELLRTDPHVLGPAGPRSILATAIVLAGRTIGWVYLENRVARGTFTPDRVEMVEALGAQAGIALENARLFGDAQAALARQTELTRANLRFVPRQFLVGLGCESIEDVRLNEVREREMSVLFVDLRGFSRLSRELGARRTVEMVNRYLSHVQPGIAHHGGFVGQYYGDGILALFPEDPDDALRGAIAMCRGLQGYNRARGDFPALSFGMGLHKGPLILGTIGDPDHFQCSVVGDSVNLASRMEGLTKHFEAVLVVSGPTADSVVDHSAFDLRPLGRVAVAGRSEAIAVFECVDCYDDAVRTQIAGSRTLWLDALTAWTAGEWVVAQAGFQSCAEAAPADAVARRFAERCAERARSDEPWDGVDRPAKG